MAEQPANDPNGAIGLEAYARSFRLECEKLKNQARFVAAVCDGSLELHCKTKAAVYEELARLGYFRDPGVKADKCYKYLLDMSMWKLTYEEKEELLRRRDELLIELGQVLEDLD